MASAGEASSGYTSSLTDVKAMRTLIREEQDQIDADLEVLCARHRCLAARDKWLVTLEEDLKLQAAMDELFNRSEEFWKEYVEARKVVELAKVRRAGKEERNEL